MTKRQAITDAELKKHIDIDCEAGQFRLSLTGGKLEVMSKWNELIVRPRVSNVIALWTEREES